MDNEKFATTINCMDGRVQLPVNSWLTQKYKVDYVDTITEPGPVKILSGEGKAHTIDSIKERVGISALKHGSKVVAVVGHYDCAGNPLPKEKQLLQIAESVNTVKSWGYDIDVIGLWVDENWRVYEL